MSHRSRCVEKTHHVSKKKLQNVYLGLGSSTQLGRLLPLWSLAYQNGKFSVGKTRQTTIITQQPQIFLRDSPMFHKG